jgi:hypothetical protein
MAPRTTSTDPATDPAPAGFSDEQKSQLEEMIKAAVGGAKPPGGEQPTERPRPTDDQWDAMSDRQRETWVRQEVDWRIDELVKLDEDRKLREKVDALAADKDKPEPEVTPTPWNKLQKWLWGSDPEKAS